MRHMSFFYTQHQFHDRTKDVTRRLGWTFLKRGDLVQGVLQVQGIKKGQRVKKLGVIRIKNVRFEPLYKITKNDVRREGYPILDPKDFVLLFQRAMNCRHDVLVTRIEYEYV